MNPIVLSRLLLIMGALLLHAGVPRLAHADEVLEWNAVLRRSVIAANTPTPAVPRVMAIVHTSMFDALNGIERRYAPIHVEAAAPRGTSARAAVAHAAYTALVALYPAQAGALENDLQQSLARIAAQAVPDENPRSIQRGKVWGASVAREILEWRRTDGFDNPVSPYVGTPLTGKWRPAPPSMGAGLLPGLAATHPFVLPTLAAFRPAGPPPLASVEYAADVNEVRLIGELASTLRTADQTESARFWAGTAPTFWNRAAEAAARRSQTTLAENARLFALLNVAVADAISACWESKYLYEFWRPITAIRLGSTDGNAATLEQADWTPLLATPAYPEYPSGHQSISGAAQAVLTAFFGDAMPVEGTSEGLPGVVRHWPSFAAAADEAFMARIWAGIHFRFAMRDARLCAEQVAAYVLQHTAQPRSATTLQPAP